MWLERISNRERPYLRVASSSDHAACTVAVHATYPNSGRAAVLGAGLRSLCQCPRFGRAFVLGGLGGCGGWKRWYACAAQPSLMAEYCEPV